MYNPEMKEVNAKWNVKCMPVTIGLCPNQGHNPDTQNTRSRYSTVFAK